MTVRGYTWVHEHGRVSFPKGKNRLRSFTGKMPAL